MKPKKMIFIMLIALFILVGIASEYIVAAPADLLTVTFNAGDVLGTVLDNAAGGDRKTIKSLKIISNGYSLSGDDFTILRNMATNGIGQLTYLDLADATCENNEIPDGAFNTLGSTGLQGIVLPNSITTIGDVAFEHCSGLTGSLNIPNGVTSIGNNAFSYCTGLNGSLIIPNSVITIGFLAFYNCSGLTGSLTIPNSVTFIGDGAFEDCSSFTGSLTISNSVTSIGVLTFSDCSGFTGSLTIPDGVTYIGSSAFSCCNFTGNLTIPDSVTTIDVGAFYCCSKFTGSLTLPNNVTKIGEYAFYDCWGLTGSLTLPENLITIGFSAFEYCKFTGNLTIPDSVTDIGAGAFRKCSGLTGSLTIPKNVTTIGSEAFVNCSGFTGNLTISDSVTLIGSGAFGGCNGFTGNLTIPASVTLIGSGAFSGCRGLTGSLTIPNSVTMIGDGAFYNCSGFTGDLTISNSVTTIGEYAFLGCSGITGSLIIPDSVREIGAEAFEDLCINSILYHGSKMESIDISNLADITIIDFSNASAIKTLKAYNCPKLNAINFSGTANLESVSINEGKIDFSGGAEGVWYGSFTGTKNISGQRPDIFTKKDYEPVELVCYSTFTPAAPVWLTKNNTDIASVTTADWIDQNYLTGVKNRTYTLSYTAPDDTAEVFLNTAILGNHTVLYTFSGYPSENYARQYTVISDTVGPIINIIKPVTGATLNSATSMVIVKFSDPELASGVDYSSLQVKYDDGGWTYVNLTGDTLYYLLKLPLKNGAHTVSFKVKDNAGNETIQPVTFTWDNYRRGFGFGRLSF